MITKYTKIEEILETKLSSESLLLEDYAPGEYLNKFSSLVEKPEDSDGYLYVRCRAISSRVNKNNDGWPSEELAKSYKSFIGRPIFIDHNNDNPQRTRGVIIDARLHVEDDRHSGLDSYYATAPESHKPPTWIELLLEVDAKTFPKLAKAVRKNDIDSVSMGANILRSVCSVCGHEATVPQEYCSHINKKGAEFEIEGANGEKQMKKAYEDCYDINFFEISFVFDPADPTALISEKKGSVHEAEYKYQGSVCPDCNGSNTDKILKEEWDNDTLFKCNDCEKNYRVSAIPYNYEEDDADDPENIHPEDPPELFGEQQEEEQGPQKIPEEERVYNWRIEQLERLQDFSGQKLPSQTIYELAKNFHFDWHELDKLVKKNWPIDLALKVLSSRTAAEPSAQEYERQLNYQPQSEAVTAPPEVNTLRKEFPCPNCKSDTLVSDPDGLMKCPTCSFVQPPHPLDNPDLSQHQRLDAQEQEDELHSGDNADPLDGIKIVHRDDSTDFSSTPGYNPPANNPIKSSITPNEINRMKWSTVDNKAVVETLLSNSNGVNFDTYREFRDRGFTAKITYPNGESTNIPFDNPIKDMVLAVKCQKEANVSSPEDLPIKVETSMKDLETVLELIHTGAVKPVKKVLNPSRPIQTEEPQPTKVISDQLAPVQSKEEDEEKEECGCGHEECSGSCDSCKTCKAEKSASSEKKMLSIMTLADELVDLGLVNSDNKLSLYAELEKESETELDARKSMVALVKESGLTKPKKMVVSNIPSMMSFESENLSGESFDFPDEALFL